MFKIIYGIGIRNMAVFHGWKQPVVMEFFSDAIGNYIRYTATNFGYSGVTVSALLTQA